MSRERRTIPVVKNSAVAADCPLAPPAHASVQARTLHRACLIAGGVQQLAQQLSVPAAELARWMRGAEKPPDAVFLACVEIVLLFSSGPSRPS